MVKKSVGILLGSLRRGSYSKKVADCIAEMLSDVFDVKYIDISHLCMYNQDLDEEDAPPSDWTRFRNEIKALNGFLFVTPEYNRSIPPILKNAVDIGSRPQDKNVWNGKPTAVITVSPGSIGGFGANHHLRQVAVCLNMLMLAQPEMYIGNVTGLFDADGTLADERAKRLLEKFVSAFSDWMAKNG
jgi:chromate reductase